jgi:hypothetical protein
VRSGHRRSWFVDSLIGARIPATRAVGAGLWGPVLAAVLALSVFWAPSAVGAEKPQPHEPALDELEGPDDEEEAPDKPKRPKPTRKQKDDENPIVVTPGEALEPAPGRRRTNSYPPVEIVRKGTDGRLVYKADEKGNVIPDFSHAGYRGGGVKLPDVPVKITLQQGLEGDDTERIQAALDRLAKMKPDERGFRGALLLKHGLYRISKKLTVPADGIVVRGQGQGPEGTVIRGWGGKHHVLLSISGTNKGRDLDIDPRPITQDYVPAGTRTITVAKTDDLKVGDKVCVVRPATEAWLKATNGSSHGWNEKSYTLHYERVITAIDGKKVTLDAPIIEPMDAKIAPGRLTKMTYPGRRRECGVESLRFENGGSSIQIGVAENCWVRNVTTTRHMYACVAMAPGAKHVTVQDCSFIDPVGPIKGGYRYAFYMYRCQFCFVQRCYGRDGRHDFVMHPQACGPNVFLDCFSDKANADSGPHHRWSVGTLYDNVCVRGDGLTAKYAGGRGTGHGWTGAQMVFWNCMAGFIAVNQPPTAQNYAIGCKGKQSAGRRKKPLGYFESHGHRVSPRSLYIEQLRDRLGEKAVRNVVIPEQLESTVRTKLRKELGK